MRWNLHGFPLEPSQNADPDASAAFEPILDQIYHATDADEAVQDQLAQAGRPFLADGSSSSRQRLRYWFLLGRCYNQRARWEQSLSAFASCGKLLEPDDHIAALHLYYAWAKAAHQAHQFEIAIHYYERLIAIWETLIRRQQADCLEESAQAFLCNLYQQYAGCWWMLGSCNVARSLLEQHAMPLLGEAVATLPTPPYLPAATQSERNWRELRVFIPWYLNTVISWQARLAPDPGVFERDLFMATTHVLEAARISQLMPECKQWLPNLYTTAAESLLQRYRLVCSQEQQALICQQAREYLEIAYRRRKRQGSTKMDRLRPLVLELPQYELRYCELLLEGNFQLMDWMQRDLLALQRQAQQEPDPGYQLLAARCAWLLGNIEAHRGSHSAKTLARSWYQQALDLITRSETFVTLNERGIRADIERL
jgi:tetratricopeptide (TPR) repeat protein